MEPIYITLRIKTLDNCLHDVKVPRDTSVEVLKNEIFAKLNIPTEKQRLIFQGKLLSNTDYLSSFKLEEGNVLHLVANAASPENNNNPISSQMVDEQEGGANPQIYENGELFGGIIIRNNICNSKIREINLLRLLNKAETGMNRRMQRRRILQQRHNGININCSESLETIRQNFTSVEHLQKGSVSLNDFMSSESFQIFCFNQRQLFLGQWVDARHATDQWLEAQVLGVRGSQAQIHYNGWASRWDEWIEMSSSRIAPFRTHTVQSPYCIYLSPHPTNFVEVEQNPINCLNNKVFDLSESLHKTSTLLSDVSKKFLKLSQIKPDRSEKSEAGTAQQPPANVLEMQTFINGMIEDQKRDTKGTKSEYDAHSLKSVKSNKSKEDKSIDYDASSIKSMKSHVSNSNWPNFQIPNTFQGYISEEDSEDSQEQEVSDYQSTKSNAQNSQGHPVHELENYLLAAQLAPIADRLGRMLIDLAPHLAMLGTNLQNYYPNHINTQNLSNISILTNEGSTTSSNHPFYQTSNQTGSIPNRSYFFQVPLLLSPSELLSVQSGGNGVLSENGNIDIHIHSFGAGIVPNNIQPQNRETATVGINTDDQNNEILLNIDEEEKQMTPRSNTGKAIGIKKEKKSRTMKSTHFLQMEHQTIQEKEKVSNSLGRDFLIKEEPARQKGPFTEETEVRESKHVSFRRAKSDKRNSGLKNKPKLDRDYSRSPQNSISSFNLESIKEEKLCGLGSPLIQRPLLTEHHLKEKLESFSGFSSYDFEKKDGQNFCLIEKNNLQENIVRNEMIFQEKSFEEKIPNEEDFLFDKNFRKDEEQDAISYGKSGENENFYSVDEEAN